MGPSKRLEHDSETETLLQGSKSLSYSTLAINSSSTSGIVVTESWEKTEFDSSHVKDSKPVSDSLSVRQKLIIMCIIIANFCVGSNYSLLGPFFPHQAEKKGFTPKEYIFVFGVFQLVTFLCSPIIGKLMPPLTPKFFLITGAFLNGSCAILFGLLQWCPNDSRFLAVAFTVQIIQAIGCGAVFTSSYTLMSSEFPDRASFFFSSVEASYGVGIGLGPIYGGTLYEVGGFFLPFTVSGSLTVVITVVLLVTFPDKESNRISNEKHPKQSMLAIVSNVSFWVDMMIIAMGYMLICFLDATLEPHIRQFHLSPRTIGLVFPITGATYALTAPMWGFICGKLDNPRKVSMLGCFFCAASYLIIGPQSFIPINSKLWLIIIGQLSLGCGVAGGVIGSFANCIKQTIARGFPNDVSSYAVVSGLTSSSMALGSFIGPSIGGVFIEMVGFQGGTLILLGIVAAVSAMLFGHMVYETYWVRSNKQKTLKCNHIRPQVGPTQLLVSSCNSPKASESSLWKYNSI